MENCENEHKSSEVLKNDHNLDNETANQNSKRVCFIEMKNCNNDDTEENFDKDEVTTKTNDSASQEQQRVKLFQLFLLLKIFTLHSYYIFFTEFTSIRRKFI